jgi:hypothetical protein
MTSFSERKRATFQSIETTSASPASTGEAGIVISR